MRFCGFSIWRPWWHWYIFFYLLGVTTVIKWYFLVLTAVLFSLMYRCLTDNVFFLQSSVLFEMAIVQFLVSIGFIMMLARALRRLRHAPAPWAWYCSCLYQVRVREFSSAWNCQITILVIPKLFKIHVPLLSSVRLIWLMQCSSVWSDFTVSSKRQILFVYLWHVCYDLFFYR